MNLINAVKAGDERQVRALLDGGADIHERDEYQWTPLNWAAGKGDLSLVRLLVDRGANVFATGSDERTPYLIALAAGHASVTRYLREVERATGDARNSSGREKLYCKAYHLRDLRRWPGWTGGQGEGALPDDELVFIHQDFTVTRSMWHGEDLMFDRVDDGWKLFCARELAFAVPDDLDLIVAPESAPAAAAE